MEGVEASEAVEGPKEVTVARVAGAVSFYVVAAVGTVGRGLRQWAWNVYAAARPTTSIFDFACSLSSCWDQVTFGCLAEAIGLVLVFAVVVVAASAVVGDVAVGVAFEPFAVEYSFATRTVRSYACVVLGCSPYEDWQTVA